MLYLVGIGAGLASALLFAVVLAGSPLSALLYSAAPLPIFIAALGWNHRVGLIAIAAGGLAVAAGLSLTAGISFAVIIALPAWWIGYLALLARGDDQGVEWYPLGRLLLWIAITAAFVTLGSALIMTTDHDGYRSIILRMIEALLNEMVKARLFELPAGFTVPDLAQMLAPWVPVGIGASFVTTITANLWIAGKVVSISGRLARPWPRISSAALPRQALVMLVVALLVFSLGGFVGVAGAAVFGALLAAFMFTGLTLLHDVSRGRPWRTPMLVSVYVALVIMQAVLTPLLVVAGLLDTLLDLRRRAGPSPSANT